MKSGYDENTYFKGLTAEVKTTVWEKGIKKTIWKVVGTKRNEPLDIRNYAYAALRIAANPDLSQRQCVNTMESMNTRRAKTRRVLIVCVV